MFTRPASRVVRTGVQWTRHYSSSTYVVKAAKASTPTSGGAAGTSASASTKIVSKSVKRDYSGSNVQSAAASSTKTYGSSPAATSSSYYSKTKSAVTPAAAASTSSPPPPSSISEEYAEYASSGPSSSSSSSSSSSAPSNSVALNGNTLLSPTSPDDSDLKESAIGEHGAEDGQDWTRSFSGMAVERFEDRVADILMQPLHEDDIEITPDGLLYLPEIKYRRILNKAFGPGGWGLAPRSEHSISPKTISREYALICRGRFVSTARGEQDYFDPNKLATASEGCKSNALMRCCKDLGIASELWDPSFVRKFKKSHCDEVFAEHAVTKRKKKLWKRKDQGDFEYPYAKSKF